MYLYDACNLSLLLTYLWIHRACYWPADNGPCGSSPCQNNGTCQALSATQYECVCPSAYLGRLCEKGMWSSIARQSPVDIIPIYINNITRSWAINCIVSDDTAAVSEREVCSYANNKLLYKCMCALGYSGPGCTEGMWSFFALPTSIELEFLAYLMGLLLAPNG